MPLATTFWETFFLLLLFIPLLMVWAFAMVDIFRRDDINGWLKAAWLVCVLLVPFFGTLIYMITRPAGATAEERAMLDQASREFVAKYSPTDGVSELQVLSDLHDRGKLTDSEFAAEKARLLGANAPA